MALSDLHCDLLWYLESGGSHQDPESRCSLPQLEAGGVTLQVLPLFTETAPGSSLKGDKQWSLFTKLPKDGFTQFLPAVENASSLASEEEELAAAFRRIEKRQGLVYISLTWKHENRFGGGNETSVGLKEDGRLLLDYLSGKRIAIDLSHTSDPLAYGILDHIDRRGLAIPLIASHSNFRAVTDHPRNLPDELAKEIIARKGVIGLNFVTYFVGEEPKTLVKHAQHALELGGIDALALGADFFPTDLMNEEEKTYFFPGYDNSSCYPKVLEMLGAFPPGLLEKIREGNLKRWFQASCRAPSSQREAP